MSRGDQLAFSGGGRAQIYGLGLNVQGNCAGGKYLRNFWEIVCGGVMEAICLSMIRLQVHAFSGYDLYQ